MSFLPQGYELPNSKNGYLKLVPGQHKFRILSNSIIGQETWITDENGNRKPKRWKQSEKILTRDIGEDGLKEFWAFVVWNYEVSKLQILQITQQTIKKTILSYYKNSDFGDPKKYDITITREGDGFDTQYTVVASPPKLLDNAIKDLYEKSEINLEVLFSGDDPLNSQTVNNEDLVDEIL